MTAAVMQMSRQITNSHFYPEGNGNDVITATAFATHHRLCPSLADEDGRGHGDQNEPAQHLNSC